MLNNSRRIAAMLACSGMAAAVGVSPAGAADLWAAPVPDLHRPDDRTAMWQGLYLGASLGHGWGLADARTQHLAVNPRGLLGGLHGGYNRQIGALVFGVEADYAWSDVDGRTSDGTATLRANFDGHGSIRARLGAAAGRAHLYGTLGYGWTSVRFAHDDGVIRSTGSRADGGLVYGGGLEVKLAPRLSLRAEALRWETSGHWLRDDGARIRLDTPLTEVRAGLTWHFNTLR